MKFFVLLLLLYMDTSISNTTKYNQEQSKIVYRNPAYVSAATTFTWRARRRDPYRTNATFTSLHAWGNNVTLELLYNMQAHKLDFVWRSKLCDIFKHKWIADFCKSFSDIDINQCPFKAGEYGFANVEMGSRYLPIPLPQGTNVITLVFRLTQTKERLLESSIVLHG